MFQGGGGSSDAGGGGSAYFNHHHQQQQQQQLFHALDGIGMVEAAAVAYTGAEGGDLAPVSDDSQCHSLLYNLSVLKDKVRQLEPLVGGVVDGPHGSSSLVSSVSESGAIIQEIITAASSMMYAFQQLGLGASRAPVSNAAQAQAAGHAKNGAAVVHDGGAVCSDQQQEQMQEMDHAAMQAWHQQQHHGGYYIDIRPTTSTTEVTSSSTPMMVDTIIELDAAELLARYTHYCQVCGKGFKRDANLRMHMRAHGDEYKSKAALANPAKALSGGARAGEEAGPSGGAPPPPAAEDERMRSRKYSCPQEGCRWNRKHAKFQPLKSVICVKNHYKRSHCPKMYICNRCNRKHFSVLSDLRTHEKHCGDRRWLCSCGTTFSRKDKLAGHVSLFAGHEPVVVVPTALGGGGGGRKRSAAPPSELTSNCTTNGGFGMS